MLIKIQKLLFKAFGNTRQLRGNLFFRNRNKVLIKVIMSRHKLQNYRKTTLGNL